MVFVEIEVVAFLAKGKKRCMWPVFSLKFKQNSNIHQWNHLLLAYLKLNIIEIFENERVLSRKNSSDTEGGFFQRGEGQSRKSKFER